MKRILSVIFVVLLLVPAISWLSGINFEINENRTKISPPKIDIGNLLDKQFYTTFDGYFNDNFNMRGLFIYTKNWLDYNVWQTLPSFKRTVGYMSDVRSGTTLKRHVMRRQQLSSCFFNCMRLKK
jgi:hypothetical protein